MFALETFCPPPTLAGCADRGAAVVTHTLRGDHTLPAEELLVTPEAVHVAERPAVREVTSNLNNRGCQAIRESLHHGSMAAD